MSTPTSSSDSFRETFTLPVPVEKAFKVFTEEFNNWWPKEYTWSGDSLEKIEIEAGLNGRCYERGPYGFECDWGRVTHWKPPHSIAFTWQIDPNRVPQPNPEKASDVVVSFESEEEKTKVNFVHRNFHRHGENEDRYLKAMSSPHGWPMLLRLYREAVAENEL